MRRKGSRCIIIHRLEGRMNVKKLISVACLLIIFFCTLIKYKNRKMEFWTDVIVLDCILAIAACLGGME